ncbi:hypothetical protein [Clostridium novyi]
MNIIYIFFFICFINIVLFDLYYYPNNINSQRIKIKNHYVNKVDDMIIHEVKDNNIYCSRGYSIYISRNDGKSFKKLAHINTKLNSFRYLGNSKILRRFISYYEFIELKVLKSDTIIVFADHKVYRRELKDKKFKMVHVMREFDKSEVRNIMPFGIAEDDNGYIYYGEYSRNPNKKDICIYRSCDDGQTWHIYYRFNEKEIRHIHSIQYDEYSKAIWVTTGDLDDECLVGYFNEVGQFIKVFKGKQKYRCVSLIFEEKYIYWAMDSTNCKNYIFKYERSTQKISNEGEVDGPVYYGIQLQNKDILFETAVEGGKGEWDNNASIWIKKNNQQNFCRLFSFKKDCKIKKRANIRLPKGRNINKMMFTVMNTEKYKNSTIMYR